MAISATSTRAARLSPASPGPSAASSKHANKLMAQLIQGPLVRTQPRKPRSRDSGPLGLKLGPS
jgi:hypothetical protein